MGSVPPPDLAHQVAWLSREAQGLQEGPREIGCGSHRIDLVLSGLL